MTLSLTENPDIKSRYSHTRTTAGILLDSIENDCKTLSEKGKITPGSKPMNECIMNQVRGIATLDEASQTRELWRREIEPIFIHFADYLDISHVNITKKK